MKKEDVKIGMKVVPFQKTAFTHSLSASTIWKRALEINQHFLYVTNSSQDDFSLNYIKGNYGGDCFNAEDFVLYKEDTIKTDNKKQIKGEKNSMNNKLEIRNVIYSNPATIVFWNDDTKTVVKTTEGEDYSPMYGVLMAYYQKHSGMVRHRQVSLWIRLLRMLKNRVMNN